MKTRIITAIIMGAIIIPVIYIGGIPFLVLGCLLSAVAGYEMIQMFYSKNPSLKSLQYIIPLLCGGLTLLIYFINVSGLDSSWLVLALLALIIFAMGIVIFIPDSSAENMLQIIMTLAYCGVLIGYVVNIRYLSQSSINNKILPESIILNLDGLSLFAYLYLITIATDIFAYFFGVNFGKRKLAPLISPNKSVEGAVAGLIFGSVFGTAFVFLTNIITVSNTSTTIFSIIIVLIISMIISFMVQLGDLIASKMKRTYEIKDFGKLFPGHGGVLDRFDSLFFSGVFLYCIILLI